MAANGTGRVSNPEAYLLAVENTVEHVAKVVQEVLHLLCRTMEAIEQLVELVLGLGTVREGLLLQQSWNFFIHRLFRELS